MRVIGYARCSTKDKQDITRQVRDLEAMGAAEVLTERESGAVSDRPILDNLLSNIETGDTLAVTEVSRLTRNLHHLCHLLEDAEARKYRIVCGTLEVDYTATVDPMHRAMLLVMGVFSEMERGVTVERIKSGLANAKSNGAKTGRPKKKAEDIPEPVKELLPYYLRGDFGKSEYARRAHVSRTALYKYLELMDVQDTHGAITTDNIPPNVKLLYDDYKTGKINKTLYAKMAGISRPTLDKYLKIIEG